MRHRLELGASAAVVAALVAGTGIALRQARVSAHERDLAVEQLRRAEATNDFSTFLLSQATPHGKPISNADLLAEGEALITRRFAGDPALRVHMLLVLADRYQENQQFDDMRRVVKRAVDDSQSVVDARASRIRRLRTGVGFRRAGRRGEGARGCNGRPSLYSSRRRTTRRSKPDAVSMKASLRGGSATAAAPLRPRSGRSR